jgi:hypothetical protein
MSQDRTSKVRCRYCVEIAAPVLAAATKATFFGIGPLTAMAVEKLDQNQRRLLVRSAML